MLSVAMVLAGLLLVFLLGPRVVLDAAEPQVAVPRPQQIAELADWVAQREGRVAALVEGAEARIQWADAAAPAPTALVFLYIHGYSATWRETAPVTERLARHFGANAFQMRLAGHGTGAAGLESHSASDWLYSVREAWEIAAQLGDRVIIVATSTGAPLAVWLSQLPAVDQRLHALLFMSPNFRVRNAMTRVLTWPWSRYWLTWVAGERHSWEPMNAEQARYWTTQSSIWPLQQMQAVVDWFQRQDLSRQRTPLALMYMRNDDVISPPAAVAGFEAWGAGQKTLIPVELDGDKVEHVFAGDITAPHRVAWTVAQFIGFLEELNAPSASKR